MGIVIIDLENTISDARHRMWLLKYDGDDELLKEEYNRQFQEGFIYDDINMNVKMFISSLIKKGHMITILTAKHEKYRSMVTEWLYKFEISFDSLVMKTNHSDSDLEFKRSFASHNRELIDFALDDVGSMCAMYSEYNIPCLRIEQK